MSADFLAALRSRFPQAADRASADHPAVNVPLEKVKFSMPTLWSVVAVASAMADPLVAISCACR